MLIWNCGPAAMSPASRGLIDAALDHPDGASLLAEGAATQPDVFLALVGEVLLGAYVSDADFRLDDDYRGVREVAR